MTTVEQDFVVDEAAVVLMVDQAIISISSRNLVEREEITETFQKILEAPIDAPDAFLILTNEIEGFADHSVIDTGRLIDVLLDVRNAIRPPVKADTI
jgi:hypothetical protein